MHYQQQETDKINLMKSLLLFCIPFFLSVSLWTYRNYNTFNRFIPLQLYVNETSSQYSDQLMSIRKLIQAWGGDEQPWAAGSEGEWFFSKAAGAKKDNPFSPRYFTSEYTMDSLTALRNYYRRSLDDSANEAEKDHYKNLSLNLSEHYFYSYKHEKPFAYHLISPLRLVSKFIFVKRIYHLPFPKLSEMHFYHKLIKGGYLLLYYLVIIAGFLGIIRACIRKRLFYAILALIPILFIFTLAVVIGTVEHRYFVPVYPFMILFASYFLVSLWKKFKPKLSG